MALYTERHGMRMPIERTSTITVEMYALLLDCCEKFYPNIAWKFPEQCQDGDGCCGLNLQSYNTHMKFDIPTLYRNSNGQIGRPSSGYYGNTDEYDQYALLDLVEFIGQNSRDITVGRYHSFFGHHHLSLSDTNDVAGTFRDEINGIFQKTGLLFFLTEKMMVERVVEYGTLTPTIEEAIRSIKEPGIKDLLDEAIALFKQPDPSYRNDAVEKLWDAFERLKTYYTTLDKKESAAKIVAEMSNGQAEFAKLFDEEFKTLTTIGNSFRIRHHETDKVDITNDKHFDYLFNRCMSLIAAAVSYLL